MDKNLEILKSWGWSCSRIAKVLGVDRSSVSGWVKEKYVPRGTHAKALEDTVQANRYETLPKIMPYLEMRQKFPMKDSLEYLLENNVTVQEIAAYSGIETRRIIRYVKRPLDWLRAPQKHRDAIVFAYKKLSQMRAAEKVVDLIDVFNPIDYDPINDPVFAPIDESAQNNSSPG